MKFHLAILGKGMSGFSVPSRYKPQVVGVMCGNYRHFEKVAEKFQCCPAEKIHEILQENFQTNKQLIYFLREVEKSKYDSYVHLYYMTHII